MRSAVQNVLPLACVDPRSHRIATIALASGDLVVRDGAPPFRILSRVPGITAHLAYPSLCRWRPDGRQIAIGTFAQAGQSRPTSFALYDLAK